MRYGAKNRRAREEKFFLLFFVVDCLTISDVTVSCFLISPEIYVVDLCLTRDCRHTNS